MRRRSTILSLPGLIILAMLITGLGLTLWRQGGLAFSPGALSGKDLTNTKLGGFNSHAEFERQCAQCHQPLSRSQGELCIACHTSIGDQIANEGTLHGSLENVMQCLECHSDHQGRDFDLRLGNLHDFDHSVLTFSLIWHQVDYSLAPMDCLACHASDDQFSTSTLSCATCHASHDAEFMTVHLADFGEGCTGCHDGLDTMARFNHDNTNFQLDGSHVETTCVACHIQGQFESLPGDCVNCHSEPFVHIGVFGLDCAACHDSLSWKPALLEEQSFDHNFMTEFSLVQHAQDYSGAPISCGSCHPNSVHEFKPNYCSECHALDDEDFIVQHQSQLGENCLECHDGIDRMRNFDHQDIFPLEGSHGEIDCQACHVDQVYRDIPAECKDCHPEPEVHAGYFGLKCEYCHDTTSWYPAQLVNHQFPIDHGDQGEVACEVCHVSTFSEYSCYGCHEHEADEMVDKHKELTLSADQLAACTKCHADGLVHESSANDE
jgi:hypothetical protein